MKIKIYDKKKKCHIAGGYVGREGDIVILWALNDKLDEEALNGGDDYEVQYFPDRHNIYFKNAINY